MLFTMLEPYRRPGMYVHVTDGQTDRQTDVCVCNALIASKSVQSIIAKSNAVNFYCAMLCTAVMPQ